MKTLPRRQGLSRIGLPVCLAAVCAWGTAVAAHGQQPKDKILRIGSSGSVTAGNANQSKDKGGLETLKDFIKEETGFNNDINQLKSWQELTEQMAKGQVQLGVFQGYEFAWAQQKDPKIKALALAVNVYVYPTAYVVVKKDNPAKTFADLKGQTLALPDAGQRFLQLFAAKECESNGKSLDTFFSKITSRENVEDALDDVVDGLVQVVVTDRAVLESFKSRKPGRFKQLKQIAHSNPFPPALVAYYDGILDEATLRRFESGLLAASKQEKGQTMLTLFKLTGFEKVPTDFGKVIAQTLKDYPPPEVKAK